MQAVIVGRSRNGPRARYMYTGSLNPPDKYACLCRYRNPRLPNQIYRFGNVTHGRTRLDRSPLFNTGHTKIRKVTCNFKIEAKKIPTLLHGRERILRQRDHVYCIRPDGFLQHEADERRLGVSRRSWPFSGPRLHPDRTLTRSRAIERNLDVVNLSRTITVAKRRLLSFKLFTFVVCTSCFAVLSLYWCLTYRGKVKNGNCVSRPACRDSGKVVLSDKKSARFLRVQASEFKCLIAILLQSVFYVLLVSRSSCESLNKYSTCDQCFRICKPEFEPFRISQTTS
ncbi:hypothetical protein L596_003798 [Steinernema carpocapsae]|uniref:Uncharacterized protein n=1 Tax=Steinernema carpocapsae TaxID=34508 RepID=A0A4U8UTS3_STECR|nr:hypothetical protein L596_003798 [Steinernema carpocapsae]